MTRGRRPTVFSSAAAMRQAYVVFEAVASERKPVPPARNAARVTSVGNWLQALTAIAT